MEGPCDAPSRAGVAATYARIGDHFASTRTAPWPEVETFVTEQGPVELAVDLGSGNGRHLPLLDSVGETVIGLDVTRQLLTIAAETSEYADLCQGDVVALPLRDDAVDLCLYVATLHHLPTAEERARSLAELARALRPGAPGLVSCWSVTHAKFEADRGHDRWVDWTLPDGDVGPRFYHLFDLDEFAATLEESPLTVVETFESSGNCFGVVQGP